MERITSETFKKTKEIASIKASDQYGSSDIPLKKLKKKAEEKADKITEEESSSNSVESSSSSSTETTTTDETFEEGKPAKKSKKAKKAKKEELVFAKVAGNSTAANSTSDREVNLMKSKIAIIESDIKAAKDRVAAKKSQSANTTKDETDKALDSEDKE